MVDHLRIDRIPKELKERPQWVVWSSEDRGTDRPGKVPHDPKSDRRADVTYKGTWGTFDQALAALEADTGYSGLGFVLTSDDPFVGIDLDDCAQENGDLEPWAREIVAGFGSFSEFSPSGKGIHVFVRGKLPGSRRRRGQIEIYDQGRYFAVTGNRVEGTSAEIEERQEELNQFCKDTFLDEDDFLEEPAEQKTWSTGLSDEEVIEKAKKTGNGAKFQKLWDGDWSGFDSQSEADCALCSMIAFFTGRDPKQIDRVFRQSGLYREKWERRDYRQRTINQALKKKNSTRVNESCPTR